jgi:hypothetical protein
MLQRKLPFVQIIQSGSVVISPVRSSATALLLRTAITGLQIFHCGIVDEKTSIDKRKRFHFDVSLVAIGLVCVEVKSALTHLLQF